MDAIKTYGFSVLIAVFILLIGLPSVAGTLLLFSGSDESYLATQHAVFGWLIFAVHLAGALLMSLAANAVYRAWRRAQPTHFSLLTGTAISAAPFWLCAWALKVWVEFLL